MNKIPIWIIFYTEFNIRYPRAKPLMATCYYLGSGAQLQRFCDLVRGPLISVSYIYIYI